MTGFSDSIAHEIPHTAAQVLHAMGVASYQELHSIMVAFPSLATVAEIDFPTISNAATLRSGIPPQNVYAELAAYGYSANDPERFALGALSDSESEWQLGAQVSMSAYAVGAISIADPLSEQLVSSQATFA